MFTKTPLKTKFRYGDIFQIYPMLFAKAPRSEHEKHFPCIIEFTFDTDKAKIVKVFDDEDTDKFAAENIVQANKKTE